MKTQLHRFAPRRRDHRARPGRHRARPPTRRADRHAARRPAPAASPADPPASPASPPAADPPSSPDPSTPPEPATDCRPPAPRSAPAAADGASTRSAQTSDPPTGDALARPVPAAGSHRGGQCVVSFFDEVPWDLVVRAVEAVTDCRWVLLYIKRWLQAPLEHSDGTLEKRSKGTPQGSAISPSLANLFMHYAFDLWMVRNYPACPFERFADDAIVHCKSRAQAEAVLAGIIKRMDEVGLRLHPDKTRIVYCKDSNRRADHEHTSFTFLGYAFRPREARSKDGVNFTSFLPAISPEALKAKSDRLREMRIPKRTDLTLNDLARWLNPIVAGWINYYGRYYRAGLDPLLQRVSVYLRRWAG